MIGAQNKSLGIADDDVQPVEQTGIGIVWPVLMGIAFQCRDVTAVSIAVNHAAIGKSSVGKFFHRRLLDIGGYLHFQEARIAQLVQRQCHENLRLFRTPAPFFSYSRAAKVCIIKFNYAIELVGLSRCPIAARMRLSMNQAVL